MCPLNCRNNINGQHCITSGQNVCEYTTIPVCMPDCSFNFTKNRCMPNTTTLSDCEPIIRLSQCPSNFTYNISVPMCDKFNTDDICIKNQIIQYPERLKNKYSNIGCVYKVHLNCSAMVYGTITGCPAGCNLDTFYNNCVPQVTNSICGSMFLKPAICPNNANTCSTGHTCIGGYKLFSIITNVNTIVYKCGAIWYYGN